MTIKEMRFWAKVNWYRKLYEVKDKKLTMRLEELSERLEGLHFHAGCSFCDSFMEKKYYSACKGCPLDLPSNGKFTSENIGCCRHKSPYKKILKVIKIDFKLRSTVVRDRIKIKPRRMKLLKKMMAVYTQEMLDQIKAVKV